MTKRYAPGDTIEAHGTTFTVVATPESHPDEPPREGDSVMHSSEDNDIVVQDYGWVDWDDGPEGSVVVHRAPQHPFKQPRGASYESGGWMGSVLNLRIDEGGQLCVAGRTGVLPRDGAIAMAKDILSYYGEALE